MCEQMYFKNISCVKSQINIIILIRIFYKNLKFKLMIVQKGNLWTSIKTKQNQQPF